MTSRIGSREWSVAEQDELIAETMERDSTRLRSFIRRRVFDTGDAEDVLQDVFYELIQTYRMMKPVEEVTAWLFRVARNRITDLFRRPGPDSLNEAGFDGDSSEELLDLLASAEAGPDAVYARELLIDSLEAALEELPAEQREVFVAHELLGQSFKELAEKTGTSINTLLSRKRYAVLALRRRLAELEELAGD